MSTILARRLATALAAAAFMTLLLPSGARTHCDTMDGPVVVAAKHALETGDVNLVLIWVQKKDEPAIREAFQKTLTVRSLNPEARAVADLYFFETLVRIHRAGEGVAYTGLKPAGTAVEEGIDAADKAIASGSADQLIHHLEMALRRNVMAQFEDVKRKREYPAPNLDAGRDYVAAYVRFIHYVEGLHTALMQTAGDHLHNAPSPETHHDGH